MSEQDGVVAVWQLLSAGVSEMAIERAARKWRRVFAGVFVDGHGAITDRQRLIAASLTTPTSVIERYSAGWFYGLRSTDNAAVTIVRPGDGGIKRVEPIERDGVTDPRFGLTVRHACTLDADDLFEHGGLRITTAARTLLQLIWAAKSEAQRDRLIRDALRLRIVTPADLHALLERRKGERGVGQLRGLLDLYGGLPIDQTKSDGEAAALAVFEEAGIRRPLVNVKIEGREGDFAWVAERYLLELDSTDYHPFPSRDEEKTRIWRTAGWYVDRLPTDVAIEAPELLIATVRAGLARAYRR